MNFVGRYSHILQIRGAKYATKVNRKQKVCYEFCGPLFSHTTDSWCNQSMPRRFCGFLVKNFQTPRWQTCVSEALPWFDFWNPESASGTHSDNTHLRNCEQSGCCTTRRLLSCIHHSWTHLEVIELHTSQLDPPGGYWVAYHHSWRHLSCIPSQLEPPELHPSQLDPPELHTITADKSQPDPLH